MSLLLLVSLSVCAVAGNRIYFPDYPQQSTPQNSYQHGGHIMSASQNAAGMDSFQERADLNHNSQLTFPSYDRTQTTRRPPSQGGSQGGSHSRNQNSIEDIFNNLQSVQNVTQLLQELERQGMSVDMDSDLNGLFPDQFGRIGSESRAAYLSSAGCEPTMTVVDLDSETSDGSSESSRNEVAFPKCVRVKRCGGCCTSANMSCTPTKVIQREVRRARIRVRRSTSGSGGGGHARAVHQVLTIEEHEECACGCSVQESDCNPFLHTYNSDKCNCECTAQGAQQARDSCRSGSRVTSHAWDETTCSCRCRQEIQCSTGFRFDHITCR